MDIQVDGDALNFTIPIDNKMADFWEPLAPENNILELTKPREFSGNIAMTKPVIASLSNFLHSKLGYNFTDDQIARFEALPSV